MITLDLRKRDYGRYLKVKSEKNLKKQQKINFENSNYQRLLKERRVVISGLPTNS